MTENDELAATAAEGGPPMEAVPDETFVGTYIPPAGPPEEDVAGVDAEGREADIAKERKEVADLLGVPLEEVHVLDVAPETSVSLADENGTPSSIAGAAQVAPSAGPGDKEFAVPSEFVRLAPPPGGAPMADVYHWVGEDVWRTEISGVHFAYRSLKGCEAWLQVAGDHSLPDDPWLTLDMVKAAGVAEPPGGSYGDIYRNPKENVLRASTPGGDYVCVGRGFPWTRALAQVPYIGTPESTAPLQSPPERPDTEVSVQVRRIREANRRAAAEEKARLERFEAQEAEKRRKDFIE